MRIGDLFGAIRRLWVLSLLLAVLVVGAVVMVVRSTPPTYQYSASMLLLPPDITRSELEGEQGYTRANPLFYLGSLTQARDILIGAMSAKDVRERVEEKFPSSTYATKADVLSSGPILVIDVESTDEREGSAALDSLAGSVPDELRRLQRGVGVKKDAMIQVHPLTRDDTPTVSQTARLRQGIMAGAALTVVGLFLVGLLDALRSQRRARGRGRGRKARAAVEGTRDEQAATEQATTEQATTEQATGQDTAAQVPEEETVVEEPAAVPGSPQAVLAEPEPEVAPSQPVRVDEDGPATLDGEAPDASDDGRRLDVDDPRVPSSGGR